MRDHGPNNQPRPAMTPETTPTPRTDAALASVVEAFTERIDKNMSAADLASIISMASKSLSDVEAELAQSEAKAALAHAAINILQNQKEQIQAKAERLEAALAKLDHIARCILIGLHVGEQTPSFLLGKLNEAQEEAKALAGCKGGWRPIEAAPKDGTEVWAFCDGEQVRMRWIEGADYALWIYADEILADVCPEPARPTHWQPLPPTPEPNAEGGA